jgi:formate dehydrogenase accessory protein FdhE
MAAKNVANDYEARIRRAERLAGIHPFAQEVLTFYRRIAVFQQISYSRLINNGNPRGTERSSPSLQDELKIDDLLPYFKEFLNLVAEHGPASVAESAQQLSTAPVKFWAELLRDYWNASGCDDKPNAAFDQFLPRAFLQPYAEHLAGGQANGQISGSGSLCPLCGARPLLGVLRPEGDGGKRFLLCSFCLREWEFRRIFCATCGEETESKLPVYVAEQFGYIRVEACETCKFYLRTIDLTKDGNAVPLVDDLAAIPLSLWAEEQGYSRAQPNLLGT